MKLSKKAVEEMFSIETDKSKILRSILRLLLQRPRTTKEIVEELSKSEPITYSMVYNSLYSLRRRGLVRSVRPPLHRYVVWMVNERYAEALRKLLAGSG